MSLEAWKLKDRVIFSMVLLFQSLYHYSESSNDSFFLFLVR
jgi:hypothetical protein